MYRLSNEELQAKSEAISRELEELKTTAQSLRKVSKNWLYEASY